MTSFICSIAQHRYKSVCVDSTKNIRLFTRLDHSFSQLYSIIEAPHTLFCYFVLFMSGALFMYTKQSKKAKGSVFFYIIQLQVEVAHLNESKGKIIG